MTDITDIKRRLHERAQEVAEHLLPNGIRQGREWCVGSIQGERGESLKVCVLGNKAGVWTDFAAGGDGGDLLDLWLAVKGGTLPEALDAARGWLGLEKPRFEKRERTYRRPEKPKCAAPKSAVLEYLTGERMVSADAIRAFRIGEQGRTIVFPSLLPDGTLAAVKYLGVDRHEGKKSTWGEAGCEPVLFGWQAVANPNVRECAIFEGEIDAMSGWDYGLPVSLSVPFGGGKGAKQQWIDSEFDRLAQFETIFLALDMDPVGETAAAEIANRLGQHRCRRVKLPRKDMNECRKSGISADEIRHAFDAATTLDPEELTRAGAFTDDVINLFWPKAGDEPGYCLPWQKVADKLRFRPGELTLWTGATGAGKSQVLSHAIVAMGEQGARICVASLEMLPGQADRSNGPAHAIPDAEDVKGTSEIASNAANIVGIWRNRKLEDEIRQASEAAAKGDFSADAKLRELTEKPPVILNVAKQRNGTFEGKVGLWFNIETFQYRSAHDHRDGRKYLPS